MILIDTSVWIDHLRSGDARVTGLLEHAAVVMHPFVLGEIACGSLGERLRILGLLRDLPAAVLAEDEEVLAMVESHGLHGRGIGYVDVHLLASVALTPGAELWTRDRRLHETAEDLGCAWRHGAAHRRSVRHARGSRSLPQTPRP